MAGELGGRSGRVRAEQRLAAGDVEPGEDADEFAVGAGDDRVLEDRRAGADGADPQRSDMHPGAGRELEVLGEPAVEHEPLGVVHGIGETHRVARPVEALLVEGLVW